MSYPSDPNSYPPQNPQEPPQYPQQYPQQYPSQYPQQPAQPAYGQPQYQQPAPQYPPQPMQAPPPAKKSYKGLLIGCGVAVVLIALVCGGIAVASGLLIQKGSDVAQQKLNDAGQQIIITGNATAFCLAVETQQYSNAYSAFSQGLKGNMSSDQYATKAQQLDSDGGAVTTCEIAGQNQNALPSINGNKATIQMKVGRENGSVVTGNFTFVKDGEDWKIDAIDPSLKLL